MGNLFSDTSQTPISNNYVKPTDLTSYAKTDTSSLINYYTKTQADNTFTKQSQINLSNYYNKTESDSKYALNKNYLEYTNANKNTMELPGDYLTLTKNGKQLVNVNNNGSLTINNNNQISTILKGVNQSNTFAIQNGNDGNDFIRIGKVVLNETGNLTSQTPFIRMEMSPSDTDGSSRLTSIRSNVLFSSDLRLGSDNNYYTISRGDLINDSCIYLKRTDLSNNDASKNYTNKQIGKWCP